MPGNWDPKVYRERAKQWRDAAHGKLSPGETREAYLTLAEGYDRLADIIERVGIVTPSRAPDRSE